MGMWTVEAEFKKRVVNREIRVSVIGLGYVGLNIACLFARDGFEVHGFDVDQGKITKLQRGKNYYPGEDWLTSVIGNFANSTLSVSTDIPHASRVGDIIVVAVTVRANREMPSYDHILAATESVAKNLSPGKLVSFESTVEPGTTESVLKPLLERGSGLRAGVDFGLVFSPNRIDPGNKSRHIWNIPKVVGGIDPLSTKLASFVYSQVIQEIIPVSNPRTAELVKLIENTQRDVNIALTNLFAKMADKLSIDIEETLAAAATKWNFMRLKPGCGVGGGCISDVAHMVIHSMKQNGLDPSLIEESRRVNESMPLYTVDKVITALKSARKDIKQAKIAILGLAYKGDCSDIQNSPALQIIDRLRELGVTKIIAYDPFVSDYPGIECAQSLAEEMQGCDCTVIATDHSQFKGLHFDDHTKVIDGRNCLALKAKNYDGIGR